MLIPIRQILDVCDRCRSRGECGTRVRLSQPVLCEDCGRTARRRSKSDRLVRDAVGLMPDCTCRNIQHATGIGESEVTRCLRRLLAAGEITVVGTTRNAAKLYRAHEAQK
jgi:hypothetical protein